MPIDKQKNVDSRRENESFDQLVQRIRARIRAGNFNDAPDVLGSLNALVAEFGEDLRAEHRDASDPWPSNESVRRVFNTLPAQQRMFIWLHTARGLKTSSIANLERLPQSVVEKSIIDGYVRLRLESVAVQRFDDDPN